MESWAGTIREEDTVHFDEAIKEGETRILQGHNGRYCRRMTSLIL